jgi:hypothetical protein
VSRPRVEFEVALDDLDPGERASFVAAVYDARGWEGERVGVIVSVRPPFEGADPQRVAPPGVTATDGVAPLPLEDLREMLRYAVTPDDRTRLCHRFFDASPDAVGLTVSNIGVPADDVDDTYGRKVRQPSATEPSTGSSGGGTDDALARSADDGPDDDDGGGDRRTVVALSSVSIVAVVLALVLTSAIVAVAPFATGPVVPIDDSSGSASAGETPSVENASEDSETPLADDQTATDGGSSSENADSIEDSASGRQVVLEESYPPGVGVDGVENVSMLAAAHYSTLSAESYRLSVTNRESVDGQRTAVAWERTVVETPARHRSTVRVAGTFRWPPSGVANASTYANGTKRIVRVGSNTDADGNVRFESPPVSNSSVPDADHRVIGPAPDTDPFAVRTASLLRRALSGTDTAVTGSFERGGRTYLWIEIRSASMTSGADEGTLLVDERGLVHGMRYARTVVSLDSTPVRRTITLRITPSNVTLVPPPWYRPENTADRRRSRTPTSDSVRAHVTVKGRLTESSSLRMAGASASPTSSGPPSYIGTSTRWIRPGSASSTPREATAGRWSTRRPNTSPRPATSPVSASGRRSCSGSSRTVASRISGTG